MSSSFMDRKRAELRARGVDPERLPPGQYVTDRFPVLHLGPVPEYTADLAGWSLTVGGDGVVQPVTLTWPELRSLPQTEVTVDIHCVTKWSRLDVTWRGVLLGDLLTRCGLRDGATTLLAHGEHGYSANLPLSELLANVCLVATEVDGEPLTPDHGAPARLVVPHLYFWKSVKWLRSIELVLDDPVSEPLGFWERHGYHEHGDPFREQRYWGDDE
jgi:DMSO/TMAO reductase YedYZ molybdopterin-dependent catalytic subunit